MGMELLGKFIMPVPPSGQGPKSRFSFQLDHESAGGKIKLTINDEYKILSLSVDKSLFDEDLFSTYVTAAFNEAVDKVIAKRMEILVANFPAHRGNEFSSVIRAFEEAVSTLPKSNK